MADTPEVSALPDENATALQQTRPLQYINMEMCPPNGPNCPHYFVLCVTEHPTFNCLYIRPTGSNMVEHLEDIALVLWGYRRTVDFSYTSLQSALSMDNRVDMSCYYTLVHRCAGALEEGAT